jgi:hypothetical protein
MGGTRRPPQTACSRGTGGIFDPNLSHSGLSGYSTGSYVLNLMARLDSDPPRVVAASPAPGATIDRPPTHLVVDFSEQVNLQELSSRDRETSPRRSTSWARRDRYFPRLVSYDNATHRATFVMLDGLANGTYEFHLSGAHGLTDGVGQSPRRQRPEGDYVLRFTVEGPGRGLQGTRRTGTRSTCSRRRHLPGSGRPLPLRDSGRG